MALARIFRKLFEGLCEFSESLEFASLKKKWQKQLEANSKLEAKIHDQQVIINNLESDLADSRVALEEAESAHHREAYSLRSDRETIKEQKQALLEERDSLQLELAGAKSRLALNELEKELMASLLETLRERTNATIASARYSYADQQRNDQSIS